MRKCLGFHALAALLMLAVGCGNAAGNGPEERVEVAVAPPDTLADALHDAPPPAADSAADAGVPADALPETVAPVDGQPDAAVPADGGEVPDANLLQDVALDALPAPDAQLDSSPAPDTPSDGSAKPDSLAPPDVATGDGDTANATCTCGDGVCDCGETGTTCAIDCKTCGNGVCEAGEGPKTCKVDCCGACGDGKCKGYDCGESPEACASDCGTACGNKVCDKGETPASCAEDCKFQACGNGMCEASDGGPDQCPEDCAASCGDGLCNKAEDFLACPVDCGYCGDGFCVTGLGEDSASCPADCKIGECNPDLPGAATPCDDDNSCTIDQCAPAGVCHHPPASGGECDDGSACTIGDHCSFAACLHKNLVDCDDGNACTADKCEPQSGCFHAPMTAACNDGSPCTVGDICGNSACQGGSPLDCEDGNPCTANGCDPASGCTATDSEGTCTDGNPCTVSDACVSGACVGGAALDCDDGNPCTTDSCTMDAGCTHKAGIGACEDGNACTTQDACVGGVCTAGKFLGCGDDNPCTSDSCDPKSGCAHKAAGGACDDGNACTVGDGCKAGGCAAGGAVDCDDGNPCTSDGCDAAEGCTSTVANGGDCSDGDICTGGDTCQAGACVGGPGLGCDDGNPCTADGCSAASGCTHQALNGACEDGNSCTTGDVCMNAVCTPGSGIDCGDANACTVDQCDAAGGCHHTNAKGACTDGDACTVSDVCDNGVCKSGVAPDCGDGNPCTDDACQAASGCVHLANEATCTDLNTCSLGDACMGGSCIPGPQQPCNDSNSCTTDSCSATAGCVFTPSSGACNDGNVCTLSDNCSAGACVGSGQASCDDGNPCTTDACPDAGGCKHVAGSGSCSDGNACTTNDLCSAGLCVGAPKSCDDGQFCTTDACLADGTCDHGGALLSGAPCNDGNVCTLTDVCSSGSCAGSGTPNCDDGNQCTTDACPDAGGCKHTVRSGSCDDGNKCTTGDACSGGLCSGSAAVVCNDNNPCTSDACDLGTGSCVFDKALLSGSPCSDGNFCTQTDTCAGGVCVGTNPVVCTAADSCHVAGTCGTTSGVCSTPNQIDGTQCNDGNVCTLGDICASGKCVGPGAKDCNDNIACTLDSCNASTGCVHDGPAMNGIACNDGDGCTQTDNCAGGTCNGANPVVCTAADQCHIAGTCVTSTGACTSPNQSDGIGCWDGNICTLGDRCVAGACTPVSQKSCDDSNPCTNDTCDPVSDCQHTPNSGNACSDGNVCTLNDLCLNGWCFGDWNGCSDGNSCTDDGCSGGSGCWHNGNSQPCDDGDLCTMADYCGGGSCRSGMQIPCTDNSVCTVGDYCSGGTCLPGVTPLSCDDANACTLDLCDAITGCKYGDNGGAVCGDYGTCGGGQCACPGGFGIVDQHCQPVLTGISLSGATLAPVFSAATTAYAAAVPMTTISANLAVTAPTGVAVTLSINGGPISNLTPGQATPAALHLGPNTLTLTAIHSGMTRNYSVNVTRLPTVQAAYVKQPTTIPVNPQTPDAHASLGSAMALSGSTLAVGAPSHPNGQVYLYQRGTSGWVYDSSVAGPGDRLALEGDTLVAGYAGYSVGAYVYARHGGAWTLADEVRPTVLKSDSVGGSAVALSGSTLVVGVPGECGGGTGINSDWVSKSACSSGAAYVFGFVGGSWVQQAYLKASNAEAGDQFGAAVALSGDTLVVGAPREDSKAGGVGGNQANNTGTDSGAVYVFVRSAGVWNQQAYLKAANSDAGDGFGAALALSGDTLLVGAAGEDGNGIDPEDNSRPAAGAAYAFARSGTQWSQQGYLKAGAPDTGDLFGQSVALDGGFAVVGAPGESGGQAGVGGDQGDDAQPGAGAAYQFARSGATWSLSAYLKASNPDANDLFGTAVAADGNTVAVGAPQEASNALGVGGNQADNSSANAGAAYIFGGDTCLGGLATECDDGNGCTTDSCASTQFCSHVASANGATCGGNGQCQSAACTCPSGWLLTGGSCRPTLTTLSLSVGTLDPAFVAARRSYALPVALVPTQASTTVTATKPAGITMTLSVNGGASQALTSGVASAALALPYGDNLVSIVATGGGNSATYDVHVSRPPAESRHYVKPYLPGAADYFGSAVAADADTVAIGAWGEDSCAVGVTADGAVSDNGCSEAGAVFVMQTNFAGDLVHQGYLKASNTGASDMFGYAVALSGNTLVVGAPGESSAAVGIGGNQADNSKASSGAVYVFVRSGSVWTQQAYIKASNTDSLDDFGTSVAISGDTMVVGADYERSNATGIGGLQSNNSLYYAGAAYVFVRSGTTWTQQAYLKASNTGSSDYFGSSVAISGNTVVVGARWEQSGAAGVGANQADNSLSGAGAAYVFTRSGTVWSQQAYIKASNPGQYDNFAGAISLSGDTLVVGATGEESNAQGIGGNQADNSANYAGAAYVFQRSGTSWSQQAYLKASNGGASFGFGQSVGVSGDRIVVGAPGEKSKATGVNGNQSDTSAGSSGAAYVFARSGSVWSQLAYLKASNSEGGDHFGETCALSGYSVVCGAIYEASGVWASDADESADAAGAAYLFGIAGP